MGKSWQNLKPNGPSMGGPMARGERRCTARRSMAVSKSPWRSCRRWVIMFNMKVVILGIPHSDIPILLYVDEHGLSMWICG